VEEVTQAVMEATGLPVGIHAHNDAGLGVANSLAAVRVGAMQIQGTVNGYGERCGNANLCSIMPDLELKLGMECLPEGNLPKLYDLAHFVAEVANLNADEHKPYVGRSAFAHKAGVHAHAMRRNARSYQHINPDLVGNTQRVLISELSGRANLFTKIEEYGVDVDDSVDVVAVLNEIKGLEAQGFSFEAAEASAAMMLKRKEADYKPPFDLIDFTAIVEHRQGRGMLAEATVKIRVNGDVLHTAAEGDGPVNALDKAMRKALESRYPQLDQFHLDDYKVRIINSDAGTAAATRVLIDTVSVDDEGNSKRWSTVGASTNIIEASWRALADAIEYGLVIATK
jgi:2-isopropylmalate synthase